MLLMRSLMQRRAGKVVNSRIRYADVKPVGPPQWLQSTIKSSPVYIETPSTRDLGLQAGVYGTLMILTYVNGTSTQVTPYGGADVPGLILATSFGASLYFMTKRNVKLGKGVPFNNACCFNSTASLNLNLFLFCNYNIRVLTWDCVLELFLDVHLKFVLVGNTTGLEVLQFKKHPFCFHLMNSWWMFYISSCYGVSQLSEKWKTMIHVLL